MSLVPDTKIGKIGFLIDLAQNRLTSRDTIFRTEPYFRKRLPGETEDVFIPGGFDFGDEEFKRDRTGRELWPVLITAVFVLTAAEMLVARQ